MIYDLRCQWDACTGGASGASLSVLEEPGPV